jgi:hypothetical protein
MRETAPERGRGGPWERSEPSPSPTFSVGPLHSWGQRAAMMWAQVARRARGRRAPRCPRLRRPSPGPPCERLAVQGADAAQGRRRSKWERTGLYSPSRVGRPRRAGGWPPWKGRPHGRRCRLARRIRRGGAVVTAGRGPIPRGGDHRTKGAHRGEPRQGERVGSPGLTLRAAGCPRTGQSGSGAAGCTVPPRATLRLSISRRGALHGGSIGRRLEPPGSAPGPARRRPFPADPLRPWGQGATMM